MVIENVLTASSMQSAIVSILYAILVSYIAIDIKGGVPRVPLTENFSTNTYAIYVTAIAALIISGTSSIIIDHIERLALWMSNFPIVNERIASAILVLIASSIQIHILSDRNIKPYDLLPGIKK